MLPELNQSSTLVNATETIKSNLTKEKDTPKSESAERKDAPEPESVEKKDAPKSELAEKGSTSEDWGEFQWMIRPCTFYKDEYKDCRSIRARFHQYFVFGETIDCHQWKTDYDNCYLWENYKSETAREDLVQSEKKRRLERLKGHYSNDVWEKREKPPEDWTKPLPEWLSAKLEKSALTVAKQYENKSYCSIS